MNPPTPATWGRLPMQTAPAGPGMRLQTFLHQRWPHAVWISAALGLSQFLSSLPLVSELHSDLWSWMLQLFVIWAFLAGVVIVLISAAQALLPRGWKRWAAMAAFIVPFAALGPPFIVDVRLPMGLIDQVWVEDRTSLALYVTWITLVLGLLSAILYESRERAQEVAMRLRTAQLERETGERDLMEARLNALRARVDPELLWQALERVELLYTLDTEEAESLLEELIVYLRAALPRVSSGASTLGQELHLADAFLAVQRALWQGSLHYRHSVSQALASRFCPPMVLLPLLERMLAQAAEAQPRQLTLDISAHDDGDGWRLVIASDCPLAQPDLAPDSPPLRTLATFFGQQVRLASHVDDQSSTLTLQVRHAHP